MLLLVNVTIAVVKMLLLLYAVLLLLYVPVIVRKNVAYVLVIVCDVAASKSCHCCGINIIVTVCLTAYVAPPLLVKGMW